MSGGCNPRGCPTEDSNDKSEFFRDSISFPLIPSDSAPIGISFALYSGKNRLELSPGRAWR